MTKLRYRWLRACLWLLVLAIPAALQAQTNPKTEKTLNKANQYFQQSNLVDAESAYLEVLTNDANNYEAAYQLGRIYRRFEDYRESLRYFRKASEIDPDRKDTVYLQIGLAYQVLGNYRKSKEALQEFLRRHTTQDNLTQRAQIALEGAEFAEGEMGKQPDFRIKNVSFNSEHWDRYPAYLDQRQEDVFLVFTSTRPYDRRRKKSNSITGQPKDDDIYIIVKENDSTFGAEVDPITRYKKINTKTINGPATFTGDGLTMYFNICNYKDNKGGCSIYESRYDPGKKSWSKPTLVEGVRGEKQAVVNDRGKIKNVPSDDRHPFVSRDGRTLYFTSDRPGGQGGFDLWYSRRIGADWSAAENLGEVINTPFDEYTPFQNDANTALYFSSRGHVGFGGADIFVAEGTIGNYSAPANVGYPVNSSYNEAGTVWMNDDETVYFASDRPNGKGGWDIYYGAEIPIDLDKLNVSIKGTIRDKATKQPVEFATVYLYEYIDDGSILALDTFSTDQTARYEFSEQIKVNRRYKILGNAPEYLANEEDVSTEGIEKDETIIKNIDIELEPIIIDSPIVLQNIYYDFDEYYIRQDALPELRKLVKLLNQNPNIMIQMGSHTDSNGTEPYNKSLSNNRAKAVVKFLDLNGIDPSRLTWFGFGESQPLIYPELSDDDEQANRRTEFRITSIDFSFPN